MTKITQIVKRSGSVVPFKRERIANAIYRAAVAVGGRDRETAERLADEVVTVLEERPPSDQILTVEHVQDTVEKVLIENGHAATAKAYILYREERSQQRQDGSDVSARTAENIPWNKIWQALDWSVEHYLYSVDRLNERIERGEFEQIVRESDEAYTEDIITAAEMIKIRQSEVRIVIITGPSSSGKTTTTIKLSHLLEEMGLSLVPLTVDNYFFDLELHPKDEFGDYDFETPQALDLELINEHLQGLIEGDEVMTPFYDFKSGKRHDDHTPLQIGPTEIVLIDSLHGLYPNMTQGIDESQKFKLYLEPLLQMKGPDGEYIRWTDLRLMRRMVRDATHRAYDPQQTLEHWHYVRKSELRNIIPYLHTTDYIINSGLPYELPLMRTRLLDLFEKWEEEYKGDPLRVDAFIRAKRVHQLLDSVTPVEDESAVPPESLLREFIGGSCYEY